MLSMCAMAETVFSHKEGCDLSMNWGYCAHLKDSPIVLGWPSRSRKLILTEAPQASTGAAHESRRSPSPFQDSMADVRDRVPRSPSWSRPQNRNLVDVRDRSDTVITIRCPICQHVLKGHANGAALKEHQANSSKCLRAQGKIRVDKEPCQYCGKPIAASDRWARVQHSYYCNGQRGSKGSSFPRGRKLFLVS